MTKFAQLTPEQQRGMIAVRSRLKDFRQAEATAESAKAGYHVAVYEAMEGGVPLDLLTKETRLGTSRLRSIKREVAAHRR